jgi:hypothetical protein
MDLEERAIGLVRAAISRLTSPPKMHVRFGLDIKKDLAPHLNFGCVRFTSLRFLLARSF